jgi:hypothetical protein
VSMKSRETARVRFFTRRPGASLGAATKGAYSPPNADGCLLHCFECLIDAEGRRVLARRKFLEGGEELSDHRLR